MQIWSHVEHQYTTLVIPCVINIRTSASLLWSISKLLSLVIIRMLNEYIYVSGASVNYSGNSLCDESTCMEAFVNHLFFNINFYVQHTYVIGNRMQNILVVFMNRIVRYV